MDILFVVLLLLAEIVGTVGGFGSSMLLVPLASYFYPFQEVLLLTATIHIISNTSKLILFHKHFSWKTILLIGIPSVLFVLPAAYFSKHLTNISANLYLGIFLIVFSVVLLVKKNIVLKTSSTNCIIAGSVSGFFAGLLGTGGAIRGIMLAAFNLEKSIFVTTSAAIDFSIDLSRFFVYKSQTSFSNFSLTSLLVLICVAFVGSYLGKLILKKINAEQFKKIVLVLILCVGIVNIYSFVIQKI
ncbi:MAG: sulfite exporter TauE/SafE family protein [Bacteroidetes bacterium]|nr:sulfite exporter TauE/SafE family protein [Bacteroidota bacterium]